MDHSTGRPARRRLSDILNGQSDDLRNAWERTAPARDFEPLPAGEYLAHVVRGELVNARTGTPGYRLTFRVIEGEHAGRHLWHDIWLTPAALPMAKRDLARLGIVALDQLERPLPQGIRCKVKVSLRREDDGGERNRVRNFEVLGIDSPEADPFAPAASQGGPAT